MSEYRTSDEDGPVLKVIRIGRSTVAEVEILGKTQYGSAIRELRDPEYSAIGEKLAVGRALRDLGQRLIKEARELDKPATRLRRLHTDQLIASTLDAYSNSILGSLLGVSAIGPSFKTTATSVDVLDEKNLR